MTIRTLPLSTNNLYAHAGRRRFMVPAARANKEAIAWEVRSQYRGKLHDGPLGVTIAVYWPDKRRHDIDNIKILLDACTGILWLDDGQITDLVVAKRYDKTNPRVELEIRPER